MGHVRVTEEKEDGDRACPCHTEYEMREISISATLHAISGQRYHDNTPAAAGPDAVDSEGLRFCTRSRRLWHVRGRKRRDGRKESYTRPQRGNHNKETNSSTKPTRRKADALSLSSPLFREYRFRKRAYKSFETKACCSSLSLGDSAQVRRKERKRRRGRRLREDVESKRCITASSG